MGYLRGAAAELFRNEGYVLYRQRGRAPTEGRRAGQDSAILAPHTIVRRYGMVHDQGQWGCYHALWSSRQLSFLLVNTYFDSAGPPQRGRQYAALHRFLHCHEGHALLLAGDQNRMDLDYGR